MYPLLSLAFQICLLLSISRFLINVEALFLYKDLGKIPMALPGREVQGLIAGDLVVKNGFFRPPPRSEVPGQPAGQFWVSRYFGGKDRF